MSRTVGLTFGPKPPKFHCPHCGKEYANEKTLAAHIAKEHPENEPKE